MYRPDLTSILAKAAEVAQADREHINAVAVADEAKAPHCWIPNEGAPRLFWAHNLPDVREMRTYTLPAIGEPIYPVVSDDLDNRCECGREFHLCTAAYNDGESHDDL